jgi:Holliday junction resolvase RusA-like endonuclease
MIHTLVILGAPRTKKNSSRIVVAGQRHRVLPSIAHERWYQTALPQLRAQWCGRPVLQTPVSVRAYFYRERRVGDLLNYEQALADALERSGIVENDKLIVSWDGSRLRSDRSRPRIELLIAPFDEPVVDCAPPPRAAARPSQPSIAR